MISVCGDDIFYVTYEVVFSLCWICIQLCTQKMRVGVVLDIPRSRYKKQNESGNCIRHSTVSFTDVACIHIQ